VLTSNSNFWLGKAYFLKHFLTSLFFSLTILLNAQSVHGVSLSNIKAYHPGYTSQDIDRIIDSASAFSPINLHAFLIDYQLSINNLPALDYKQSKVYTYKIDNISGATRLFFYSINRLPENDTLFIYNSKGEVLEFFYHNNIYSKRFVSEPFSGELAIQLVQHSSTTSPLFLETIALEKNAITSNKTLDFGDSGPCEININCEEGDDHQDVKRAVVRIQVRVSSFLGWCTGTILNNTAYDYTPYLLTAEHCGIVNSSFVTPANLSQWTFYFNYESPDCSNPASEGNLADQKLTGATLLANSDDNGGDFGSDFILLELDDDIPDSFSPYYAGWNRSASNVPKRGVVIHHPQGDIKKISTYGSSAVSGSFGSDVSNTHWLVQWSTTVNGKGVTEQGSSGSALLDENDLVRGVLTGGEPTCNDPSGTDFFGKFSYSWNQNGSADNRKLQPWLDSLGTGSLAITGANKGDPKPLDTTSFKVEARMITSGAVKINGLGSSNDLIRIQLFDLGGKLIYDQNTVALPGVTEEIDVSFFRNGMYVFRLWRNDQLTNTEKLVILN